MLVFKRLGILLVAAFVLLGSVPLLLAGQLEITLADNRKIVTPYCWEEGGEIKFPMPGGVAGVDKSSVVSIREVVSSGEVVISEMARVKDSSEFKKPEENGLLVSLGKKRRKAKDAKIEFLKKELAQQDPYAREIKPLSASELDMVEEKCILTNKEEIQKFFVANLRTAVEKNEIVRKIDKGYVIVLRNVIDTPYGEIDAKPVLTLYDQDGNIISEVPAQLVDLKIPREKAIKYGLDEKVKAVVSVFPLNCDVRRYEVSFVYNY